MKIDSIQLQFLPLFSQKNQIFYCYGVGPKAGITNKNRLELGSCCDTQDDTARNRSVGEYIERRTIFQPREKKIAYKNTSYDELVNQNLPVIPPPLFSPFSSEQLITSTYKSFRYSSNKKIHWTKATDLISKKDVLLPHSLFSIHSKKRIYPGDTSGTACHTTSKKAVTNTILEVIERDALSICFFHNFSGKRIDLNTINNIEINTIVDKLSHHAISSILLDITSDMEIPTFLTILHTYVGKTLVFAMGASTEFTGIAAIKKSLLESYHTLGILSETVEATKKTKSLGPLYGEITPVSKRLWWWTEQQQLTKDVIDGITNYPTHAYDEPSNTIDSFTALINHLRSKEITHVYTTELYQTNSPSFFVYKTLIPQLALLPLDEKYQYHHQARFLQRLDRRTHNNNLNRVVRKNNLPSNFLLTKHPFP